MLIKIFLLNACLTQFIWASPEKRNETFLVIGSS